MKILHTVQLYEPAKGGSEEVIKQLSERLAARGHDVTVATASRPERSWNTMNGVSLAEFDLRGNIVLGVQGEVEEYRRFLRGFRGDVMLNYAAQIWSSDLAFDLLDHLSIRKVMVPCGYSGLADPRYKDYFRRLPNYLNKYDALVYMSENYQDKKFGDEAGLRDRAVIIPNGASREEFSSQSPASFRESYGINTTYMVLTVANHHELKGHRRLVRAVKSLRRRDMTLVIIGEPLRPPWVDCYLWCRVQSAVSPEIRVLKGVPRELVVSAYREADVFALASDIECAPLVIYESMAAGTPFVSTNCGNVKDNESFGIVVDDPAKLNEGIEHLLESPQDRQRLGDAGRRAWEERFTWDMIVEQYEDLYARLVGGIS